MNKWMSEIVCELIWKPFWEYNKRLPLAEFLIESIHFVILFVDFWCVLFPAFIWVSLTISTRNTLTDEGIELVLTVMEAKELIGPPDAEQFDTFVRIYMVPDETVAQQTKVYIISFYSIPFHSIQVNLWRQATNAASTQSLSNILNDVHCVFYIISVVSQLKMPVLQWDNFVLVK